MKTLKKYIPLVISFALGVLITYFFMKQLNALEVMYSKSNAIEATAKLEAENEFLKRQRKPEQNEQEEKHWFDERMEQEAAESQERTKEQRSLGDALKNQFEKFAE
ncbi:MAG: hypothetical protein ACI9SQ_000709 [Rubritalea sp.]|jgi:hypothetical protein